MLMEHTTIKEIAGKARVSPATVSRIINGKYRRKSKTVVNVERIIEELRFSRNRSETLETQAPGCIGVIMFAFPDFLNDKYTTTLSSSIMEALTKENLSVHLIAITNKRLNIEYIENQIKTHNIRGLLVLEFDILYAVSKTLESLSIPVISIGNMTDNTLSCNVCADNYRAGCDAANYLWCNGHRSFSIVTMACTDVCQKMRLSGFMDTVKSLGGDPKQIRTCELRSSKDSISGWISELINKKEYPDSIFCFNSTVCQKIYSGLVQSGIRVPEDVSLISFEEDGELEFLPTPMSVVAQPTRDMGVAAVDMLVKSLNGININNHEVLNCSLIIRNSVRSVPAE